MSSAPLVLAMPQNLEANRGGRSFRNKLAHSSSFKGLNTSFEHVFSRDNEFRKSTGSIRSQKMDNQAGSKSSNAIQQGGNLSVLTDQVDGHGAKRAKHADDVSNAVHNLIKVFNSGNNKGSAKTAFSGGHSQFYTEEGSSSIKEQNDKCLPPSNAPSPIADRKRSSTRRKLSLRRKGKMTVEQARYNILQSIGLSPFAGTEQRSIEKSFAYFDVQCFFFDLQNAQALKGLYEEGAAYLKKVSGASAASRRRFNSGEFDPELGRFRSRSESILDEGDEKSNELVVSCPYFRNEVSEPELPPESGNDYVDLFSRPTKDISKLIAMFNRSRTRSYENVRLDSSSGDQKSMPSHGISRIDHVGQHDSLLEEVRNTAVFYSWDNPNRENESRIFEFEHIDEGCLYYREYFVGQEHTNVMGMDEIYGPVAISIKREQLPSMVVLGHVSKDTAKGNVNKYQYRIIVRTCELYALRISVLEDSIPSTSRHGTSRPLPLKDIIEFCFPSLSVSALRHSLPGPKVPEQLQKLDEQQLSMTYKIGLLYCKANQGTEEDMYNNEVCGDAFMEFYECIADKVRLKGFEGYRAQLDNKSDSTGTHSLYTKLHSREIMFHVSTLLPFTAHDKQQLLRKRHIGNDIVTIIFQEPGAQPFSPKNLRSHFQHVFIVVQVENPNTEFVRYKVAVSRSRDVPYFGPPVPPDKFGKNKAFREFLLCKAMNAENAAHKSDKFTHMARRTRYEYLKDLATNCVSAQTLEPDKKFGFPFGSKKKEKTHPPVNPEIWAQGAMVWSVKFEHQGNGNGNPAFLGISAKSITVVDQASQETLLCISSKSVLGWRPLARTLKLYYENCKVVYVTMFEDDLNELTYVINRLKAVTPGCETQDMSLRRNTDGQLGFHVYYEGLVAEVEPYGLAWMAGLRKGSRLLEINNQAVGSMSHERMITMLKRPGPVRVVILPPTADGQPRNYKAIKKMRRYSSMTSVYSMGLQDNQDSSSTRSSRDNLTGSVESNATPNDETKYPSVDKLSVTRKQSYQTRTDSTASDRSDVSANQRAKSKKANISSAADRLITSNERLITSRSAQDFSTFPVPDVVPPLRDLQAAKIRSPPTSPTVDLELSALEKQLADTRRSIDAKFYRSLADGQTPLVRARARSSSSAVPPEEIVQSRSEIKQRREEVTGSSDSSDCRGVKGTVARRPSDLRYPIVNERVKYRGSESASGVNSALCHSDSEAQRVVSPVKVAFEPKRPRSSRSSLEAAFQNPRQLPAEDCGSDHISSYDYVDSVRRVSYPLAEQFPQQTSSLPVEKPRRQGKVFDKSEAKAEWRNGLYDMPDANQNDKAFRSRDGVLSSSCEPDSIETEFGPAKGSLVKSQVRDVSDIINERKLQSSPSSRRRQVVPSALAVGDCERAFSISDARLQGGTSAVDTQARKFSIDLAAPVLSPTSKTVGPIPYHPIKTPAHIEKTHSMPVIGSKEVAKTRAERRAVSPSTEINPNVKLDASLSETFAKIDAAFASNPCNSEDVNADDSTEAKADAKKKRRSRRRNRHSDPPESDTSEDFEPEVRRRVSRSQKKPSLPLSLADSDSHGVEFVGRTTRSKSEAEASLEAAITEFSQSIMGIYNVPSSSSRDMNVFAQVSAGISLPKRQNLSNGATANAFGVTGDRRSSVKSPTASPISSSPIQSAPPVPPLRDVSLQVTKARFDGFYSQRNHGEEKENLRKPRSDPGLQTDGKQVGLYDGVNRGLPALLDSVASDVGNVPVPDSEPKSRVRSEATINLTSPRPWSPPNTLLKRKASSVLRDGVASHRPNPIAIEQSVSCPDEADGEKRMSPLSPTRGGIMSLPNRSQAKRQSLANAPSDVPSVPLAVRGLDLAAARDRKHSCSRKEDLQVMVAVMGSALESERAENNRLEEELKRTLEENERLFEQSQAAAKQLRKFTTLFLESTPAELEKARQKFAATK